MNRLETFFKTCAMNISDTDNDHPLLSYAVIETPLSPMIAIGDDKSLYLLQFMHQRNPEQKISALAKKTNARFMSGITQPIRSIEQELAAYFAGTLQTFTTPVTLIGTTFSKNVWQMLQKIPYGQTASYARLAAAIGKPTAYRAVARANSINFLPIIIPCHRIINANGNLGGYNGGIAYKVRLLELEKRMLSENGQ